MEKRLPFVAMIVLQFVIIGSSTLSKSAMTSGLSPYVFVVYYKGLGTIFLLPWFACHCMRGKRLPLTFGLLCRFFALSLTGSCLSPICLFTGLSFTSVTIGASIGNLTPIFTYLIAICLRMERIDLRKYVDQIKALGTFVAVLGALVVTLYKGPSLLANSAHDLFSEHSNWPLGCVLYTLGYLFISMWNILQADTAKLYPDEVTIVFFCSFFGSIQNAVASFFMVKDSSAWHLNLNVQIISVVYTAFMVSLVINPVLTWCLRKKGPVFVTMFDPLNVAIAALAGFVFLADGIYLGSVIGSAGIIGGFYAVMWGQAKTTSDMVNKIGCLESASSQVTPLLQTSQITGYTERP